MDVTRVGSFYQCGLTPAYADTGYQSRPHLLCPHARWHPASLPAAARDTGEGKGNRIRRNVQSANH